MVRSILSALANPIVAMKKVLEGITNWNCLLVATSRTLAPPETGCWAFVTMVSFTFGVMIAKFLTISLRLKTVNKIALSAQRITISLHPSNGSTTRDSRS